MADEPEVVVDLDKVDELRAKQGITETVEPAPDAVEESIDTLKARLSAAETRAANAEAVANQARGVVHQSGVQEVSNTIEMLERETNIVEQQLIEAQHAQDWDKAIPLQRKYTANVTNIENLKARKITLENAPQQQPQPVVTVTRAEQMADEMVRQGAPRSAAWLRSHPDFANDTGRYNLMLSAHHKAVGNALAPESDEYFAFVERELGMGSNDQRRPNGAGSSAAVSTGGRQAAPAPAAAPVSRGGTGTGGSRGRTVTLTADEARTAKENKMSPEEYWLQKQALIKEGKITQH